MLNKIRIQGLHSLQAFFFSINLGVYLYKIKRLSETVRHSRAVERCRNDG